jgi:hypothetical protein
MKTVDQNRFSGCGKPTRERVHGTRARASKVFGPGKSLRAEVQGFTLKYIPNQKTQKLMN